MFDKIKYISLIMIVFSVLVNGASALPGWYDTSYLYRVQSTVSMNPTQYFVTLHQGTGTNTANDFYCQNHCLGNFNDTLFVLDNTTLVNFYVVNASSGQTYINITSNGTLSWYYGKSSDSTHGNANLTFPSGYYDFEGATTTQGFNNSAQSTTQYYDNNNSLSITGASAGSKVVNSSSGTPYSRVVWTYLSSATQQSNFRFGKNSTHLAEIGLNYCVAGKWCYYNGVAWVEFPVSTSEAVGWHKMEVVINTNNTWSMFIDDVSVGNGLVFFALASTDGVVSFVKDDANIVYVDSLFVRNNRTIPQASLTSVTHESSHPFVIIASDTLRYSNDTQNSSSSSTFKKLSEIQITSNYTGSIRVKYALSATLLGETAYSQVYLNDNAISSIANNTCCSFILVSEDITTPSIVSGDTISIYGNVTSGQVRVQNFRIYFDFDYANSTPVLTYPTDGSTISFTFPPQITDVNFTWSEIGASGYEIMIGRDVNFNILVDDATVTTPYSVHSLDADTFYWKVRTYNDAGATLGAWSPTSSFTLSSSTTGIAGTVLNGVVYELDSNGNTIPINGASVYLSNATNTYQFLTGSNGYYQFEGLVNTTTYSIYAIKQGYDNSQTFLVVPTFNATTTLNIPMRIFISPYIPNFVFEKYVVRTIFDEPYPGLTINIFRGSALSPSFTGTTDNNGAAVFQLIKDTYYRIEISGGSLTSTLTFYFYAKDETQRITIAQGFPTGGDKYTDINSTLFVTTINSTHSNLSLYYSDNISSTSIVYFYATNLTTNTSACTTQNSSTFPITLNCTVVANGTYQFGFNATSSVYGFFQLDKVINFNAANPSVPQAIGSKVSSDMLNWLSIIGLLFVAGLFSQRSVRYGVVVVPGLAVLLYWFGALVVSAAIVHMALAIGIMIHLRMNEQKVIT